MVDDLEGPEKATAKLFGFDGAYLRFAGELRVERCQGEELAERHTDDARWELTYFDKARPLNDAGQLAAASGQRVGAVSGLLGTDDPRVGLGELEKLLRPDPAGVLLDRLQQHHPGGPLLGLLIVV
jgi:hypothetical protein